MGFGKMSLAVIERAHENYLKYLFTGLYLKGRNCYRRQKLKEFVWKVTIKLLATQSHHGSMVFYSNPCKLAVETLVS